MTDLKLMKRVRTLLTITIVSLPASTAIGAPIHTAAEKGNLARVRTLLNNGVAVDAKDGQGRTPLYMAASWGRKQVVQLLIDKGADVNAKNNNGQTPLGSEVDWKHHDIAEIIRKHQALALVPKLAYGGYQQLLIDGAVGQDYDVLYSSDLKEWNLLDTVMVEESPQVYVDDTAEEETVRFSNGSWWSDLPSQTQSKRP